MLAGLEKFLSQTSSPPKLIIAGHSLGGASACILAGFLTQDPLESDLALPSILRGLNPRFSKIHLRSFGTPRVSTKKFESWLSRMGIDCKNFATENDEIPSLPPYQALGIDLGETERRHFLHSYDPYIEPIILTSFSMLKWHFITAHDIRLYWIALAKQANIPFETMPLFRLSIDSQELTDLITTGRT